MASGRGFSALAGTKPTNRKTATSAALTTAPLGAFDT